MGAVAFAIALLALTPSASTLAAVAVFAANADRKWPVDEREPFVTAEALRLMEAAVRAIADDGKLDSGELHGSLTAFAAGRAALEAKSVDAEDRPRIVSDALASGRTLINDVATALHRDDTPTKQRLSELKRTADVFDRKRPTRQQAELIEQYFRQAATLLRGLLNAL